MELWAELTGRDGLKRPLRVSCQPPGELRGLLGGLAQLREQVSALLGPLVQQESGAGDQAGPRGIDEQDDYDDDDDEEEEEEEEEKNHISAKACADGPPLKRIKTQS